MRKILPSLLFLLYSANTIAQETKDSNVSKTDTNTQKITCGITTTKVEIPNYEIIPTNFIKILDGLTTGLQVTNMSGQPGSMADLSVRGIGTMMGNSQPLIVLDGAPYYGDINAINIDDIKTITILKDAITAIRYGGQSGNGVIEIVTKTGRNSTFLHKKQFNINAQGGIVTRELSAYNVIKDESTYYELAWESYRNALLGYGYSQVDAGQMASGWKNGSSSVVDMLGYNNYNVPNNELIDPATGKLNPNAKLKYPYESWKNEMQRIAFKHNYNLNFSGRNDKNDYYLSAGYLNEGGYLKQTNYERFTVRGNGSLQILRWLKAGLETSLELSTQHYADDGDDNINNNPFAAAVLMAPVYPVYYHNANGEKENDPVTGRDKFDWGSIDKTPESSIGNRQYGYNSNPIGSLYADTRKDKVTNANIAPYIEATFLKHLTFKSSLLYTYFKSDYNQDYNSYYGQYASVNGLNNRDVYNTKVLDWNQTLQWKQSFSNHNIDILAGHETLNLKNSINAVTIFSGGSSPATVLSIDKFIMESYFAIANYNFEEKYFFKAGYRQDGSSQYHDKWHGYWAFGVGWQINNENFMSSVSWINDLSLRASYGLQGNLNSNYGMISNPVSGINNSYLNSDNCKQMNVGVTATFLKMITISFDYFIKKNNSIINLQQINPVVMYYDGLVINNNGMEVSLNIRPVISSKFSWDIGVNFTHYNISIAKMPAGLDTLIMGGDYLLAKNTPLYSYYLPLSAGVDVANGDELYYYSDNGVQKKTSDYALALQYGRKNLGSALPKGFGSVSNQFVYKNWSLGFIFTYSFGGKYYDRVYESLMDGGSVLGQNWSPDILDRWTPENTQTNIPRLEMNNLNMANPSSRFIGSNSYLSLRGADISYTFSDNKLKNIGLKSLSIYCAGDNIWLWAKRKGMNPQATLYGNPGYEYLPARTVLIGVKVGL